MTRRLPLIATVLVLAAVATMIALGFWQLQRRAEKAQLITSYEAAVSSDAVVEWPDGGPEAALAMLYRRARLECETVSAMSAIAGSNARGESGLAITARCGTDVLVVLGWSRAPVTPDWQGGTVVGVIAPGPRLVADPPIAGLEANAVPDPSAIPNNHLSYAVQWFLFAFTALVIYALALRKRLAGQGEAS
jgi:surfeit locus 1 family protein